MEANTSSYSNNPQSCMPSIERGNALAVTGPPLPPIRHPSSTALYVLEPEDQVGGVNIERGREAGHGIEARVALP